MFSAANRALQQSGLSVEDLTCIIPIRPICALSRLWPGAWEFRFEISSEPDRYGSRAPPPWRSRSTRGSAPGVSRWATTSSWLLSAAASPTPARSCNGSRTEQTKVPAIKPKLSYQAKPKLANPELLRGENRRRAALIGAQKCWGLADARILNIRIEMRALCFVQPLTLVSGGLPERREEQRSGRRVILGSHDRNMQGGRRQLAVRKEDSADMKSRRCPIAGAAA